MKLIDYLTAKNIKIGLEGDNKKAIINELLDIAGSVSPVLDREKALKGLLKRESIGSTGIGGGVAIPHAGIDNCSRILPVLALSREGLDFSSLDGEPVRIFFLILYPDQQIKMQLKFLARVSRLLRNCDLRESLLQSSSPEEAMNVLSKYESEHFT